MDTIILCTGQQSFDEISSAMSGSGIVAHVIGGAKQAAELDAYTAIKQGTKRGLEI